MSTVWSNICLLALDVDGVLTDGRLWYTRDGEACKSFHVHDGAGLKRLRAAGIDVALVSARHSDIVAMRATELDIARVHQGVDDKGRCLTEIAAETGLAPAQCAFMGDDVADLPAFAVAGLRLAPANAVAAVRTRADWCTAARGGEGAVREVCERLIAARTAGKASPCA